MSEMIIEFTDSHLYSQGRHLRTPSQGAGIVDVEAASINSTYSDHHNTGPNGMPSTIPQNLSGSTSSTAGTINGGVNVDELLSTIRSMAEEQKALKEEVEELKKQLGESVEFGKTLEKKVEDMVSLFNTDQLRMPARLHNSICQKSPNEIKAPPITPGKIPKNFPATRGEFEHLTRERYEGILNEYKVKHSGDVHEKRETLRAFLGLPTTMLKK